MTAFRVFSGWDIRQAEAAEVFAYSVRANASIEVDLQFIGFFDGAPGIRPPDPQFTHAEQFVHPQEAARHPDHLCDFTRQGVTGFSYIRFLVPFFCGFEGRALFADGCDQLCLGDVAELADFDMEGRPICVVKHPSRDGKRPRVWTSLMLLDCANNAGWFPETVEAWPDDALMRLATYTDDMIGELPGAWNVLMGENALFYAEGDRLLHWSYLADPNGNSWIDRSHSTLWAEWRKRWRAER